MTTAIIVYVCLGFMVLEIALSPDDPNHWFEGLCKKAPRDRIPFSAMVLALWPIVLIAAIAVAIKNAEGGDKK